MQKKIMLICSMASYWLSCTPNNKAINLCESSPKVIVASTIESSVNRNNNYFLGGFINVKTFDFFKSVTDIIQIGDEDSSYNKKYAQVFEDKSCTAYFDVQKNDDKQIEVVMWTAKHCLFYQGLESVDAYVNVNNHYLKFPLTLDIAERNKKVVESISSSKTLQLVYFFGADPENWQSGDAEKKYSQIKDSIFGFPENLRNEVDKENIVFSRPLCRTTDDEDNDKLTFDGQKACFLYDDLIAVKGVFDLTEVDDGYREEVKEVAFNHLEYKKILKREMEGFADLYQDWTNLQIAKPMINFQFRNTQLQSAVQMYCADKDQENKFCDNYGDFNTKHIQILEAYNTDLEVYLDDGLEIDYAFQGDVDPYLILQSLQKDWQGRILVKWLQLNEAINDRNKLYLHANFATYNHRQEREPVGFLSMPLFSLIGQSNSVLLSKSYGFVHFLPESHYEFEPRDSGSFVSWFGILPLVSVSTIDDDDVSGGVGRTVLPEYIDTTEQGKIVIKEDKLVENDQNIRNVGADTNAADTLAIGNRGKSGGCE